MSDSDPVTRLNSALEGRYHIERQLGEGGMATVYLADDLRHERKVAVKVLKPELAAVVGAERFLAEIKTTANLQHPHILPLHDSGEADTFLFYVMPYVEGESLRERLDREHQLGVQDALNITQKVAGALDYAHNEGVVHRDIKPGNILLSKQGEPLVADFGIALAVAEAGGGRITETGLSLGTPHYMSPEQATGDQMVGRATDTYALACVLYEMLVGEPPYTGSTAQAVLGKIIAGKVASATEQRAAVPAYVDAAIQKALEKLPADRFTSARGFASALTDPGFTHGTEAVSAAADTSASPWNRLSVLTTALSAILAVALGFALMRPERPRPPTRFTVSPPEGTSFLGICCGPVEALSPDGEWLAFVTGAPGGPMYRRQLGQLEAEIVPGTAGATIPFFSPDGRWIGFNANGRLLKVPMSGGPAVPIADVSAGVVFGASWGDNDVVVFSDGDALYTVPGGGGVATQVPGTQDSGYMEPSVLPGGASALARIASAPADGRVVAVDLETGTADTLVFATRAAYASGHLVYSGADGTLLAQPFDPRRHRTTGQSVALLAGIGLGGPNAIGEFALSTQGGLAYEAGSAFLSGQALILVGPTGENALSLPVQGNIEDPAFSPDGRRIAMRFVNVGESQDIWIFDRDQGGTLQRLTDEGTVNSVPVWTPDGDRIAFARIQTAEPPQLYWQSADGSGAAERLLRTDFSTTPGSWSPDGRTLAIVGRRQSTDIGMLTLGDSTVRWRLESEFEEFQPQFSPDGRWLAYTSDRSGQLEVYVEAVDGEGGRQQVSIDGGHSPRWAPHGDTLYFARGGGTSVAGTVLAAAFTTDGGFRVSSRSEKFGDVDDLNTFAATGGDVSVNYDVSPDGSEFVHIRIGAAGGRQLVWILNWPEIVQEMQGAR